MFKKKNGFRWVCVGLLCGGLLLIGAGAGVMMAELSSFSYGGKGALEAAEVRQRQLTLTLDEFLGPDAQDHQGFTPPSETPPGDQAEPVLQEPFTITVTSNGDELRSQLIEVGRVESSEAVPSGTLELSLTYDSAGPDLNYWTDWSSENLTVWLYWYNDQELATLLRFKDQLLTDLRNRQVRDYEVIRLTGAVVTVNPADLWRVRVR